MRKTGNINFVLIGAKATGKTVYLASLYLNLKNITSQNGKTIDYLKPLANSLLDGEYPQATSGSLHELMFDYKDEEYTSHIQIDDVDGYFVESMHKKDEATQTQRDTLLRNIKMSEGIIFFFPYEERFNEESIKNFNYEIDTIISQLKKMYKEKSEIPIPVVIAVSKWDKSPHYQDENEEAEALEYINSNKFLKLAKEKIEQNFTKLKIIPLSSVGINIERMEPYNLEKPIQFFLRETYAIWEEKIESLKNDKKGLLSFLSKVHFDMKFYEGGKYNKAYDLLEKEFTDEILSKLEGIENYSQFLEIEKAYKNVIPFLIEENQVQIAEIGKKFKSKQTRKKMTTGSVIGVIIVLAVLVGGAWFAQSKLMKSESELFSDISVKYKNHNYKEAMKYVEEYQASFKDTLDVEHKNKVEEIRGNISSYYTKKLQEILNSNSLQKQYDGLITLYAEVEEFNSGMDIVPFKSKYEEIEKLKKGYEKVLNFSPNDISSLDSVSTTLKQLSDHKFIEVTQSKKILEKSLIAIANNIVCQVELDDTDNIDDLLSAFANLGIDSPDTIQELTDKKNDIQTNCQFTELKDNIQNKNFQEAIEITESNWSDQFNKNSIAIIKNMLDKKANAYIEKKLKSISYITDMDEYNEVVNILTEISRLKKDTTIANMGYKLSINNSNRKEFIKQHDIEKEYYKVIHNGIDNIKVSFRAKYEENEPLGFACGGNEEGVILKIDNYTYHYDNKESCENLKITWIGNSNRFKVGNYAIDVEEYDYFDSEEYNDRTFKLNKNDLIKISNGEEVEKDIGNNYFIGFQK